MADKWEVAGPDIPAPMGDRWEAAGPDTSARSTGENINRAIGMFPSGINESIATTVGAVPDLVGAGMRAVGIPSSEPGFYTQAMRRFLRGFTTAGGALPEAPKPETTTERAIFGAGKGAADAASVMIPATAVARVAKAGGVTQGIAQTLAAQPATQLAAGAVGGAVTEATDSPLAGLGASMAVPLAASSASRVARPIRAGQNPGRAALVAALDAEKIPMSAAERTGSTPLRLLETGFETLPVTSAAQAALKQEQHAALNQAVMARTGTAATDATPSTLAATGQRLGAAFQGLASRNTLDLTAARPQLVNLADDVERLYASDTARPVIARIREVLGHPDAASGRLPGQFYAAMDSELGKQIRATTNDGITRSKLEDLRGILRRAMDDSISPEDAAAWAQARREYANFKVIQRAMAGAGENAATGDIPPAQLRTALQASVGRDRFTTGAGDLNDIARAGQSILRDSPNSWTAGRAAAINALQGGVGVGALVGGANPWWTAAGYGTALALPRAIQAAYNTDAVRRYLSQTGPLPASIKDRVRAALVAQLTSPKNMIPGVEAER